MASPDSLTVVNDAWRRLPHSSTRPTQQRAPLAIHQPPAKEELLREKQPMLQFTTPQQIGALAVFLCGEGAATMTGAALSIDGGWTAQ